jgi:PPOX class probable F420-dependent enzyme
MREDRALELLRSARRGVLVTIAADGTPRPVPLAYAAVETGDGLVLYSALDEKPKRVEDPRELARVRDIRERPRVAVLVDRWDEDWSRLAWVRLTGTASVLEPADGPEEHGRGVAALRARYPQYATQRLEERPLIRISVERSRSWAAASGSRATPVG